jgi:hypothetical protein
VREAAKVGSGRETPQQDYQRLVYMRTWPIGVHTTIDLRRQSIPTNLTWGFRRRLNEVPFQLVRPWTTPISGSVGFAQNLAKMSGVHFVHYACWLRALRSFSAWYQSCSGRPSILPRSS